MEVLRDAEPARATELARRAAELAPDDYAAWTAVRDLIGGASVDERLAVTQRLASLSSGWAAAEALTQSPFRRWYRAATAAPSPDALEGKRSTPLSASESRASAWASAWS